jgi:hypothetical protein
MRNYFLIFLLLVSANAFAQKWELGLDGGITVNSVPSFAYGRDYIHPSKLSLNYDIKLVRNFKKWQLGISAQAMQLSCINTQQIFWLQEGDVASPFSTSTKGNKMILANPAVPLCFFVNRKVLFRREELFGGISAGYAFLYQKYKYSTGIIANAPFENRGDGYTVGLHIGGTYHISKHIGLNGEIDADYIYLNWNKWPAEGSAQQYYLFTYSATLGIRYSF